MIYLVVGGSCAGKTSFVVNSFVSSDTKVYKDLVTLTECDNNILFGDYTRESRTKGTDTISRADLDKLAPQIDKLIKEQPNKNIILEGTKIISRNLFNHIMELNVPTKVSSSIKLIDQYEDVYITWESSKPNVINADGCFFINGCF